MGDTISESVGDVRLRPVGEEELHDVLNALRVGYADGLVAHAGMSEAAAAQKADADFDRLCPGGVPEQALDVFVVEEATVSVGFAMLGERDTESGRVAFVYAIELDPEHRGRGIGRAAMRLLETRARERDLTQIALNVFGGNAVARGLYRSLGYDEIAVYMGKAL